MPPAPAPPAARADTVMEGPVLRVRLAGGWQISAARPNWSAFSGGSL